MTRQEQIDQLVNACLELRRLGSLVGSIGSEIVDDEANPHLSEGLRLLQTSSSIIGDSNALANMAERLENPQPMMTAEDLQELLTGDPIKEHWGDWDKE